MVVTRLRKKNFSFLSRRHKVVKACWCKQPTSRSFQTCLYCIYLFKMYDKSVIISPTNNWTNIWSDIRNICFILQIDYTCNLKGLEEIEKFSRSEWPLHRWPRSVEMSDYTRPYKCRQSQSSRRNVYEETNQELGISGNTGTIPK